MDRSFTMKLVEEQSVYIYTIKMETYYIMNASGSRELLTDKSWRANSSFLIIKTADKKRPIILAGSGHDYGKKGDVNKFVYDTGSRSKNPPYGKDTFKILKIIEFDSKGNPNKSFKATGKGFYVMK